MIDFFRKRSASLKDEILSGITVALALVPEAVAFSLIAGVEPLTGLYAAFMVGLVTACIGGRPGMISGATGALAVVIVSLVADHGVAYLFPAVVLMGLIQIGVGLLRLGKFIRLVPHPVMLGFVNGLAIVIFLAQLDAFRATTAGGGAAGQPWLPGDQLLVMLGLVGLTMAIIAGLPKLTRAVPASLVAIVVVSLLAALALPAVGWRTPTVFDMAGSISGGLPAFSFPHPSMGWGGLFSIETLLIILPYSLILAGVGLIESLMTLSLIDEITETRGRGNRECIGQGAANVLTGCFGGMGGCAMIGQSLINVNSGGRKRLSGIVAAVGLLACIMFAASLIENIPLAALVGVMFMVVIGTFEWATLRMWRRVPASDLLVMLSVVAVTVLAHNLALAVLIGVVVSALVFAWKQATHLRAESVIDEQKAKIYHIHGMLFFGSVQHFRDLFDPAGDPDEVIVDFYHSRVCDQSGLEALNALADRYGRAGKNLHLRHLSPECRQLLDRAAGLVDVSVTGDPDYHVSTDRLA